MFKKIILLVLTSSIVFSCIIPASADDTSTYGEVVDNIVQASMAEVILDIAVTAGTTAVGSYFGQPQVGAYLGPVIAGGILNYADYLAAGHTDQDIYDQFTNYNTQLETDLGTSIITDGAVIYYFTPTSVTANSGGTNYLDSYNLGRVSQVRLKPTYSRTPNVDIAFASMNAPFSGVYSTGVRWSSPTMSLSPGQGDAYTLASNVSVSAGSKIYPVYSSNMGGGNYGRFLSVATQDFQTLSFSWYAVFTPVSGLPTDIDISPVSRPSSFVGPVGVRNEDNSYTVYNQTIVNETDSTIFNPVTNITTVFTDWAFDYSTRTYTLTLEDGSTVTVIYGDDYITIVQGDQEYTVYYVIPSEEDPGVNPDDPGTDDGSGWAWLKGAWTEMMDKLTGILEAITNLELSPEINVDVDVDVEGEEPVTQESWFSDVLAKFAFLTSVHDIYTQLVADVTSDAATAAAVADGEVMLADVTSGHAAIDGRASYTAPELAISFGSSDKYGVDWASIRPLNLSWYAPRKETVDGILSGILWLSYLFLLIKRAPGIIRGAEMVTEDRIKIYDWHMRNDP